MPVSGSVNYTLLFSIVYLNKIHKTTYIPNKCSRLPSTLTQTLKAPCFIVFFFQLTELKSNQKKSITMGYIHAMQVRYLLSMTLIKSRFYPYSWDHKNKKKSIARFKNKYIMPNTNTYTSSVRGPCYSTNFMGNYFLMVF